MKESALGFIETYGFIGAVEALDWAVKTANVQLVSCEFIKGGIVTILISGDVSSVKEAVESASIAANKLGVLLNSHVIARASHDIWNMLTMEKETASEIKKEESKVKTAEKEKIKEEEEKEEISEKKAAAEETLEEEKKAEKEEETLEEETLEEEKKAAAEETLEEQKNNNEEKAKFKSAINKHYTKQELEKFKVTELRTIVRGLKNSGLTKNQIKFGKKEELIEAILMNNNRR